MNRKSWLMALLLVGLLVAIFACATTRSHWQEANNVGTIEAYENFLKQHPQSEYTSQARAKLAQLYEERDWERATQAGTIAAYEKFLVSYKQGAYAVEAKRRIEILNYNNAIAKDDLNTYLDFLRRYPNSSLKNSLLPRVEALMFGHAKSANTIQAYQEFLKQFPNGAYASQARAAIARINDQQAKERERLAQQIREEQLRRERLAREEQERRERLAKEEHEYRERLAREERERLEKEWAKVREQNTVQGYREYLERNPRSEYAPKVRQYLTVQKVEGWVQKVDLRVVTIKTAMGKQEVITYDSDVKVNKRGKPSTLKDLKNGESVMIEYNSLPDKAVSKTISVGYSVSHCSCGDSCTCPLSRGCRVIRY